MTAEDGERRAVTCDGRLLHRQAAATGSARHVADRILSF